MAGWVGDKDNGSSQSARKGMEMGQRRGTKAQHIVIAVLKTLFLNYFFFFLKKRSSTSLSTILCVMPSAEGSVAVFVGLLKRSRVLFL